MRKIIDRLGRRSQRSSASPTPTAAATEPAAASAPIGRSRSSAAARRRRRGASRGLSPVKTCTPTRLGAVRQRVGERAAGEAAEEPRLRAADDDLGDVLALGVAEDLGRQVVADQPGRFGAEALRQPQRRVDSRRRRRRRRPAGRPSTATQLALRPVASRLARAHHVHRQRVGADADQQALGGLPRAPRSRPGATARPSGRRPAPRCGAARSRAAPSGCAG